MALATGTGTTELAVIGNCQVAGLLDEAGRLVWACLPRPDADPTFCALLTGETGVSTRGLFAVDLVDCRQQEQQYLRNSAVIETRLSDALGNSVRQTDFCPRFRQRGRVFRPPAFVRIVEPLQGKPQVRLHFRPCTHYGAQQAALVAGSHHLRFTLEEMECRLTTNASLTALTDSQPVLLDGPLAFIIGADNAVDQQPLVEAHSWLEQTLDYWQEWVRSLAIPFDWQEAVIRAAITLKLCTYEDTGAVLAALTTSLPEVPNSGRNWDYRFCWLRDSYFVVQSLNRLGATRTMEGYLRFINNIVAQASDGVLGPLYTIAGIREVPERIEASLQGYCGMGPVRSGNAAALQRQNDVYGAVILAACQYFYDMRLNTPGDAQLFRQLEILGQHAVNIFDQPDAGPWEYRLQERVHTFPAVMCWAACDRLARIALQLDIQGRAVAWRAHADMLRRQILASSWNARRNCLCSHFGGDDIDASLLLLPELGFMRADDMQFKATLAAVERELRVGDLLFRYRHADDFGLPQTAFTVCSFWYVNALAAAGRLDEARSVFKQVLQRRNRLGLLSEDIDPVTGRQWGNFPQTYSMVGIITSALRLSRSWEQAL